MASFDYKIPVLDFLQLSVKNNDQVDYDSDSVKALCNNLISAFKEIGFVYLKNTGVSEEEVTYVRQIADCFFSLDEELKSKYEKDKMSGAGWVGIEAERSDQNRPPDLKETFNIQPTKYKNWPDDYVPGFKSTVLDFYKKSTKLAHRVLQAIAVGLDITDKINMTECHKIEEGLTNTVLRLNHYPPLPQPEEIKPHQLRHGEHTDWGTISLLFQDEVGGLQVQWHDGIFRPATPIPGTVLVNVADLLQRWTADTLISSKHRVLIPEEEQKRRIKRQSMVLFVHPNDDLMIECLEGSNKYPPVKAIQYLISKLDVAYL